MSLLRSRRSDARSLRARHRPGAHAARRARLGLEALEGRVVLTTFNVNSLADILNPAPGTVTQVVEDGYTIHGRLLRPARVVVSKRRVPAEPEFEDNDLGSGWAAGSATGPDES